MKTKYIKVNVSERLPDKDMDYHTNEGTLSYKTETKDWYFGGWRCSYKPKIFLEEVPDREYEYREMLEKIYEKGKKGESPTIQDYENIEKLLKQK